MHKKYDYNELIKRSIQLAFKIDKALDISVKPRGYGKPLISTMISTWSKNDEKSQQNIIIESKKIEIEFDKHFQHILSPSQIEFWYEVLTDWFSPLSQEEAFLLKLWCKKVSMKNISSSFEKKYGSYVHRKTIYNRNKNSLEKIKYYLWQKNFSQSVKIIGDKNK